MYGFNVTLAVPFATAVDKVTEALKQEGFGVLSDIDVQGTLKAKIGVDTPAYRILGACNPRFAHRALSAEPDIGLLLPCNVTVRQGDGNQVLVGFLNPDLMVQLTANPALKGVAEDASARLRRVRDALQAAGQAKAT
jgi:uncharacterized protein (DUF302 family)